MDETWTTLPFLGVVPHFHSDPAEGGAPQPSADGHWWWDGTHWVPVHVPTLEDLEPVVPAEPVVPVEPARTPEAGQPAPAWAKAS